MKTKGILICNILLGSFFKTICIKEKENETIKPKNVRNLEFIYYYVQLKN